MPIPIAGDVTVEQFLDDGWMIENFDLQPLNGGDCRCTSCCASALLEARERLREESQDIYQGTCVCGQCDSFAVRAGSQLVTDETGGRRVRWCEDCAENYAYYWESEGGLHSEPEPEEPEEPEEEEIPDYHSTRLDVGNVSGRPELLGIEIETYQSDTSGAAAFLSALRRETKNGVKFERDGSLDRDFGVEIVCRPASLDDIRAGVSPWRRILDWSRNNHARGWNAGPGYGVHISINGGALQSGHRARIVRFINDNPAMCERIAGRKSNEWARYCGKTITTCDGYPDSRLSAFSKESRKYLAAANRGDRIEVRIFRSSLNWERFLRNCQFCDSIRVYCEFCGNSDRALSEASYRQWLRQPSQATRYRELAVYLGEKEQPALRSTRKLGEFAEA